MTNQMLEALLHISINVPPVGEAQEPVKEAVEAWSNAKKRRKLPPSANQGGTSSGNSQSEVQAILADSAFQTDIQVQEDEKVEEASVQAEVEVMIRMILLLKVKMNTKHSIAILGTRVFFCNSIF